MAMREIAAGVLLVALVSGAHGWGYDEYDVDDTCSVDESFRCFVTRVRRLEEQTGGIGANHRNELQVGVRVTELTRLLGEYKRFMQRAYPRDAADPLFAERVPIDMTEQTRVLQFGDIHGSIHSLLRAVSSYPDLVDDHYRLNKNFHLVTTGDFTDRGVNGVDTYFLWVKLKLVNPDQVTIIRGNHETELNAYNSMGALELPGKLGLDMQLPGMQERLQELMSTLIDSGDPILSHHISAEKAYCVGPIAALWDEYSEAKARIDRLQRANMMFDDVNSRYEAVRGETEKQLVTRTHYKRLFLGNKKLNDEKRLTAHRTALKSIGGDLKKVDSGIRATIEHHSDHAARAGPLKDQYESLFATKRKYDAFFADGGWAMELLVAPNEADGGPCAVLLQHLDELPDLSEMDRVMWSAFESIFESKWKDTSMRLRVALTEADSSATFRDKAMELFGYPPDGVNTRFEGLNSFKATMVERLVTSIHESIKVRERTIFNEAMDTRGGPVQRLSALIRSVDARRDARSIWKSMPALPSKYLVVEAVAVLVDSYKYLPTMAMLDMRKDKSARYDPSVTNDMYMASHGGPEPLFDPSFLMQLKASPVDGRARMSIVDSLMKGTSLDSEAAMSRLRSALAPWTERVSTKGQMIVNVEERTYISEFTLKRPRTNDYLRVQNRFYRDTPWCLGEDECAVKEELLLTGNTLMWADVFHAQDYASYVRKYPNAVASVTDFRGMAFPPPVLLAYLRMFGLSGYLRGHQHNGITLDRYLPDLKGVVPLSYVDSDAGYRNYKADASAAASLPKGVWHTMLAGESSVLPDHYTTISATASQLDYHINGHVEIMLNPQGSGTIVNRHWCEARPQPRTRLRTNGRPIIYDGWHSCFRSRGLDVPDSLPPGLLPERRRAPAERPRVGSGDLDSSFSSMYSDGASEAAVRLPEPSGDDDSSSIYFASSEFGDDDAVLSAGSGRNEGRESSLGGGSEAAVPLKAEKNVNDRERAEREEESPVGLKPKMDTVGSWDDSFDSVSLSDDDE